MIDNSNVCVCVILFAPPARKSLRHRVPIVLSDNDIPALLDASTSGTQAAPGVRDVVDLFVAAQSAVHMLRAIEPQLRHGARLRRVAAATGAAAAAELAVCPLAGGQRNEQCVHVAARKHVGDALVRWEDEVERLQQLHQRRGGAS